LTDSIGMSVRKWAN